MAGSASTGGRHHLRAGHSMTNDSPQLPQRGTRRPRANGHYPQAAVPQNDDPNTDSPEGRLRPKQGSGRYTAGATKQPPVLHHSTAAEAAEVGGSNAQSRAIEAAALKGSRPAKRQRAAKAVARATLARVGEWEAWEDDAQHAGAALAPDEGATAAGAAPTARPKARQRRQRVLVDVHGRVAGSTCAGPRVAAEEPLENEYERQRLERIRRNEQMLQQLGVAEAAGGLAAAVAAQQQQQGQPLARSRVPPRPRERRQALPAAAGPMRKSARQRGDRPLTQEEAVAAAAAELGAAGQPDSSQASEGELGLLDLERYFQIIGRDISQAVHSDGRFHGWVNPSVGERYGIAGGADAAWEAAGVGNFSFKIDASAIPSGLKGRGWSDVRAFSHSQLQKNPNAYFYRHVAPHEQQAQGEWTEEEHQLFLETARAHGVGDKWGLFASYLPQRVGYQCSAYYRDVIIPQGLVIDRRFKLTRNGKAVYVG